MSSPASALIVTVRNAAAELPRLFTDLSAQSLHPDEVIITVATSSDTTLKVTQDQSHKDKRYKVFSVDESTRAEGRNLAIGHTHAKLLVFTDAGCRLDPRWFQSHIRALESSDLTSGLTLGDPKNEFERAQVPYILVPPQDIGDQPLPATRNMGMRRSVFERVGPFIPKLNTAEDFEWSRRAQSLGVVSHFVPEALVYWRPRKTTGEFWSMIFLLTQGDVQAGTWRTGHSTMLARYAIVIMLLFLFPPLGAAIWIVYLLSKSYYTAKKHATSWQDTILCQVLADSAVCSGILTAFGRKYFS